MSHRSRSLFWRLAVILDAVLVLQFPRYAWGQLCGTFSPAVAYPAGDAPEFLATADFNGDGEADLVVSNLYAATVRVMFGLGDGTFREGGVYPTGPKPIWISAGDIGGDGSVDLVTANIDDGTITLLRNRGDGAFEVLPAIAVGDRPATVAVADFNRDGLPDIAVGLFGGRSLKLFYASGPGSFGDPVEVAFPGYIYAIVAADLNRDHHPDLVVDGTSSEFGQSATWALYWRPDGSYAGAFPTPLTPGITVAVGDVNGDGWPDLVGPGEVSFNNHDGTFSVMLRFPVGVRAPRMVATADFNGDGSADIVVTGRDSANIALALGWAGGTIETGHTWSVGQTPRGICVADFDRDGRVDVATANSDSDDISVLLNGIGPSAGLQPRFVPLAVAYRYRVVTPDFNADGHTDLATVDMTNHQIVAFHGIGDGTFVEADHITGIVDSLLASADLNGDGLDDLVASDSREPSVFILQSLPGGGFSEHEHFGLGAIPTGIAIGDFSGDGMPDLVVSEQDGKVSLLVNIGGGDFAPFGRLYPGGIPVAIAVIDLDGDGFDDILIGCSGEKSMTVFYGSAGGSFATPYIHMFPSDPGSCATADFNADKLPDLVVANGDQLTLMLSRGERRFGRVNLPLESPFSVAAADFDGDGIPDVAVKSDGVTWILPWDGKAFGSPYGFAGPAHALYLASGHFDAGGSADLVEMGATGYGVYLQGPGCAGTCRPDCNHDGKLNVNDFICMQSKWMLRDPYGDYDKSGTYTVNDFIRFQADFARGCP